MKRLVVSAHLLIAAFLMTGCLETSSTAEHSSYSDRESSPTLLPGVGAGFVGKRSPIRVDFDPENQVIPFPNNLLFEAGATSDADFDGTLNVPGADGTDSTANVARALSDLDGFSTVEAWRLGFTGPIDASTLVVGQTIRVFELEQVLDAEGNPASYPQRLHAKAVKRELTAADLQINYEEDAANNAYVVYILPKKPLAHNTTYSVIFTYGILDKQGLVVDAPLAATVSRGTTKLGLNSNFEPTRCHQFFSNNDFDDPEQERSLTLLQCMTYLGYHPVVKDPKINLIKEDIMISWAITTQRKDEPFERLVAQIVNGQVSPEIPTKNVNNKDLKCTKAICLLDVGTMKDKPTPLTPGGNAVVFPGTIRLPVMTKGMRQTLNDVYNLNFYTGKNNTLMTRERAEQLTSGTWSCGEKGVDKEIVSCNTDEARNNKVTPQIEGWVHHPVVLALPLNKFKQSGKKFPLVIFQHAIQQDRTNALAFADSLAAQGFAVIGIDMPLHGMEKRFLDMGNPKDESRSALYLPDINANFQDTCVIGICPAREFMPYALERTYYMDLVSDNEATDADGNTLSDNEVDPSGAHFLNPALPLAQRDILRQASIDLAMLSHYLRTTNLIQCGMSGGAGTLSTTVGCFNARSSISNQLIDRKKDKDNKSVDATKYLVDAIDFSNLHFVGHSVGNIVATPFLAMDKNIKSITMLAPAGVLLRTLEGSEVIGKKLSDGLGDKGVFKGTENYYRFFASVQAAIDPAEPFNYLNELTDRPINIVVIHGDQQNAQDKVLPWTIAGSAMAGSEHLVRLLGIETSAQRIKQGTADLAASQYSFEGDATKGLQMALQLNRGDHASFLLPKNEVFAKAKKEAQDAKALLENHLIGYAADKVADIQYNIEDLQNQLEDENLLKKDRDEKQQQLTELEAELLLAQQKLAALELELAEFFIPETADDIFAGDDVHTDMQKQVANFLKNNALRSTEINSDILYIE